MEGAPAPARPPGPGGDPARPVVARLAVIPVDGDTVLDGGGAERPAWSGSGRSRTYGVGTRDDRLAATGAPAPIPRKGASKSAGPSSPRPLAVAVGRRSGRPAARCQLWLPAARAQRAGVVSAGAVSAGAGRLCFSLVRPSSRPPPPGQPRLLSTALGLSTARHREPIPAALHSRRDCRRSHRRETSRQ